MIEFDILPSWLSDIFTIVAFIAGPTGLIWLILNQRNANRRLKVEEVGADVQSRIQGGKLTVDQFNAALPAYKDLLDRSNADRDDAIRKMEETELALRDTRKELTEIKESQEKLVNLFIRIVQKNQVKLSEDEICELEATWPTEKGWGSPTITL